jgi:hypothetical protein
MVRLEQGQARDGYDAQNEVRGYRSLPDDKPVVAAIGEKPPMRRPAPAPAPAPAPVRQGLGQWAKKLPVKDDEIPF